MRKKYLKGVITISIVSIIIIASSMMIGIQFIRHIHNIQIGNRQLIREASQLVYTKAGRDKAIEQLKELLRTGHYLSIQDRAQISTQLAQMYIINTEYEKGLDYTVKAIYLVERLGEQAKKAQILIDMSNIFVDLQDFKTAEETIHYALSLDIEDPYETNNIKKYAYINLADIYSKTHKSDKALEYISKSMLYCNKDEAYYEEELIIRQIIEARALFYKNDIKASKGIIAQIESEIAQYKNALPVNIAIPYLGVKAKVEIAEGNLEKGLKVADKLFKLCDQEGLIERKKVHMEYIANILESKQEGRNNKNIRKYEQYLLKTYHELITIKNKDYVIFVGDAYENKINYFKVMGDRVKFFLSAGAILVVIGIVTFIGLVEFKKVKKQRDRDALTGIYNRGKFNTDYKEYLNRKKATGLIIIDIDHFKHINDTYGHSFGDVVLKNVVKLLINRLPKYTSLYRYGGEEFCIVYKSKSLEDTAKLAETLRLEVEQMRWREGIQVTISLGASYTDRGEDLFDVADKNLYRSKETGRNKVSY